MTAVEPIKNLNEIRKIETILEAQSLRDLLIFTIGINCGLRISDILALNIGDVQNKSYIQLTEKKTGKYKKIPINAKLKPLLEKYVKGKSNKEEPLFLTVFNNRMERVAAYYMIRNACKKANIQANVGTHTLRKTFGYHHYHRYKDIALLQKIFNHSSPQTTLRYIGIDQETIEESYSNFIL